MWRKTKPPEQKTAQAIQLGSVWVEVQRLPTGAVIDLLFIAAPLWSKIRPAMSPEELMILGQENLGPLYELVSRCTNRNHLWIHQNATLPQLLQAVLVADRLNRFSEAFELVRQLGWAQVEPNKT